MVFQLQEKLLLENQDIQGKLLCEMELVLYSDTMGKCDVDVDFAVNFRIEESNYRL